MPAWKSCIHFPVRSAERRRESACTFRRLSPTHRGNTMNPSSIDRRKVLGALFLAPLAGCAGLDQPAPKKQPNFLFLLPDQHRFDWLSGNPGLPIKTPNLDWLAERGVRFAKAYCASATCAPSRAALAAGRDYDRCGVGGNWADYPSGQPTYYRKLRESGYHVAACGKLDLSKGSHDWGVDGRNRMQEWGFTEMVNNGGKGDAVTAWLRANKKPVEPYMAYLGAKDLAAVHAADTESRGGGRTTPREVQYSRTYPTPLSEDDYADNWVGRTAEGMLQRFPKDKPWHLVVNFSGPHDPMDITSAMEATVRGRTFAQPNANTQLAPEIHNTIRQNYTAMVENIDRWVGKLIEGVRQRGELDNTVFVYSSDHGEMLGDHDRWAKTVPYQPSVCVPLIVAGPGMVARRSDALVSMIDISATLLDYAGAQRPEGMTAQSLRPLLEGKSALHRTHVTSGLMGWRMVTDGRYKLIRGFDPAAQKTEADVYRAGNENQHKFVLFDLARDPLENVDIAAANPDIVARLAALLPAQNPDPNFGRAPRGTRPD
ncbi:sulfatase family protein [Ramlibacter albus]|uniref:Sulfatase-like hydrolase/transferase n=1 Tax=Ramlibacter albus TaxID=2079448 RepID=A0A923S3S2_9BURK|nr:sulfatase-like hydrolase/transferase [Ramlibacter albus]MBC5766745.1 sulfatase-like hydrolase/transferase [Ramlibacter albus]